MKLIKTSRYPALSGEYTKGKHQGRAVEFHRDPDGQLVRLAVVKAMPITKVREALDEIRNLFVFCDEDGAAQEILDPDNCPGGSDAVDLVVGILERHGLMPQEVKGAK